MSFTHTNENATTAAAPAVSTPPPSLQEPLAVPVISPTASSEAEASRQKRRRERRLEMNRLAARNRRRRQRDLLEDLSNTVEGLKETNSRLKEENAEMKKRIQEFANLDKQKQLSTQQKQAASSTFKMAADLHCHRREQKEDERSAGITKDLRLATEQPPSSLTSTELKEFLNNASPEQPQLLYPKSAAAMDLFASGHLNGNLNLNRGLSGLPAVRSPALSSGAMKEAFPPQKGSNMEMALQAAMALRAAQSESLKQQLLVLEAEEELCKLVQSQRKQQQHMMDLKEAAATTGAMPQIGQLS